MKFLFSLILFSACMGLNAQEHQWNLFPGGGDSTKTQPAKGNKITGFNLDFKAKPGQVKVSQDNRVDKITAFIGEPQTGTPSVRVKGFRVQLFFDTDKDQVNQKRAEFQGRHKDDNAYVDYLQPNFRLRAGDFRTKLQAQKLQDEVKIDFPDAIIVEDWVELPSLKITE